MSPALAQRKSSVSQASSTLVQRNSSTSPAAWDQHKSSVSPASNAHAGVCACACACACFSVCRYKAFLDKWWRKKSLVDTIFMVGHWSREHSNAYIQDLSAPPPVVAGGTAGGTVGGDTVVSRVDALQARRAYRYAMNCVRRFTASDMPPGSCNTCQWQTDWERDADMQPRVQCFSCTRLVCRRWCCVPEFLVCKQCHPGPELPVNMLVPATVPITQTSDACSSCGISTFPTGQAAGSADSRAGRQPLRMCTRCNRWLCVNCRQQQAPTTCVVCPALQQMELPSLRQARTGPSATEIERLRVAANRATMARGRGRLSSGQYLHQQNIDGRAERVARGLGKRPRLDE